ncbi:TetR/AcrR family transcriptional regulator [Leucobacter alluvii]|uniref:TetR/AcrR family transcriptional regulator n=1 Tax=Leucobacter alluvii TaxID=340321 RepID=A0ABP5MYC2_9MICO
MGLRSSTEARILDAAEDLFFSQGIISTPIDAITARAGVSPATLYRGYASKDALLAAVLERRQNAWIEFWDEAIARASTDEQRLLAIFDALEAFREQPRGSRWCAFLGASAEYASAPPEVAAAIRADTDAMRYRLTRLAEPVSAQDAPALAEQLLLIVSGDLAMRLRAPDHTTGTARAIAASLIAQRA